MKIRTLIIDDELASRERLRDILSAIPSIEISGEAADGTEAVRRINELRPDLLFLDIRMPGASGFEVLERATLRPLTIFVTAYDQYAIQAFEENAVDYILKPFSSERIMSAVERVLDRKDVPGSELIERLRHAVLGQEYLRLFAVKVKDGIILIPEQEVYFFSAGDKYVFLHTKSQEFFYEATLKELESQLDPSHFQRIHRSHIVALDKIRKLKKWFRGEHLVQLSDEGNSRLKISRNYHRSIMEKLRIK